MFNNTDKDVFLTYYKMQKNTDMKKELRLLAKMRDIDRNIRYNI